MIVRLSLIPKEKNLKRFEEAEKYRSNVKQQNFPYMMRCERLRQSIEFPSKLFYE